MTNVNETVVSYLAAWNERDPKRRREFVAAAWTEEGSYIDAHRHGHGHNAIDAMLAATQAQFPNHRLSLVSGIEAHNNFVRFSWAARRHRRSAALYRRHRFRNARAGRPDEDGRRLHGRIAGDVRTKARVNADGTART
jgi:hypothetical protein